MLRAASLAVLAVLAALMAACGGGAASGGADPASAVPADAPSTSRSSCSRRATCARTRSPPPARSCAPTTRRARSASSSTRRCERTATRVARLREGHQAVARRARRRVAHRATASDGDPVGAAVVAITDQDAAQAAVDKARKESGDKLTERSYKGVDYQVDEDGDAVGITEDFLIVGPGGAVQAARSTRSRTARRSPTRTATRTGRTASPTTASGTSTSTSSALVKLGFESEPNGAEQLRQFQQLVPLEKLGPLMGSFAANGDRLALDMTSTSRARSRWARSADLTTGASTPLLKELPGDTWGAFGAPKYGESLQRVARLSSPAPSAAPRWKGSCASSTGSTSTTTCSAGSATSRSSSAATASSTSTAAP